MSQYSYPSPQYIQPQQQQQQYYLQDIPEQQQWENVYCKIEETNQVVYNSAEVPMYYEPNTPPYTPTYSTSTNQHYYQSNSPVESYFPRTEPLESHWQQHTNNSPISSPTGSTYSSHSLPATPVQTLEAYERRASDIGVVYSNNPHTLIPQNNTILQAPIELKPTRIPIIDEADLDRPEELSKPFVLKLSYLLSNPELFSSMIQWDVTGKSFIVAPSQNFINGVLVDIFSHKSLPAFYRQLKTYNFTHLTTKALSQTFQYSPDATTPIKELSAWTSPFFRRDKPELMVRLAPRLSKARLQQRRSKLEQHYSVESRGRNYSGLKMGRSLSG